MSNLSVNLEETYQEGAQAIFIKDDLSVRQTTLRIDARHHYFCDFMKKKKNSGTNFCLIWVYVSNEIILGYISRKKFIRTKKILFELTIDREHVAC